MTSVLLDRVSLERGPFRLEADCSFGPGLHVVTGRIGSGKSTLALALAGGLRPASGAIRLEGVRRRVLVLQSPDHHLTGATVAAEAASWGVEPGPLLDRVGLTARAGDDPFRLSRGEQKRLVLGCALADRRRSPRPGRALRLARRPGPAPARPCPRGPRGRDDRDDPRRTVPAGGRDPMADTGRPRRPGGVMDDPRLRLLSVAALSVAAFASIPGTALAALWWLLFSRRALPAPKTVLYLGVTVLLAASRDRALRGRRARRTSSAARASSSSRHTRTRSSVTATSSTSGPGSAAASVSPVPASTSASSASSRSARSEPPPTTSPEIRLAVDQKRLPLLPGWFAVGTALLFAELRRGRELARLLALRGYAGGGTARPAVPAHPHRPRCRLRRGLGAAHRASRTARYFYTFIVNSSSGFYLCNSRRGPR